MGKSGGLSAIFIVAILLQCIISLNEFAVKPSGKTEVTQHFLFPELYSLDCVNTTLHTDDYEMFPNSSLYVKKYDLILNSSSYAHLNDSITICKPSWVLLLDKLTVNFYFSFIVFMTHAQTPIAFCFGSFSKLFLTFVCSMPAATLLSLGAASTYTDFIEKCMVTVAVLAYINVSTLGWMTLLSSNYMVRFLEARQSIRVEDNKVILMQLTHIAQMGLIVAPILSVYSFAMIAFGVVKKLYGVDFLDKIEGDKMMILFAPPILLFLLANFLVSLLNYDEYNPYCKDTSACRENIRLRHRKYFLYYLSSIFFWLFGSYALMIKYWLPWYFFVIANVMLPIYWIKELLYLNIFTYDVPTEYPKANEGGYTVLFKLGKKFVKLDFDYNTTERSMA